MWWKGYWTIIIKFDLETFIWIGITVAVFKRVGKVSVVKERLNKSGSCSEMRFLSIFKTLFGMLYGPVDLLISREERMNLISSLLVGEMLKINA